MVLTLWTPEAGIPAAQYINATGQRPVYRRHGSQRPRPEAGIPDFVFYMRTGTGMPES